MQKQYTISNIKAREILDSRGNPTVEVDVTLAGGGFGRASVPSGASTGSHEALELRDNDKKRYNGLGVLKAVDNVNTVLKKKLVKKTINQTELDSLMISIDGTPTKSALGANALLGVSMAFAKAAANADGVSLYKYFNTIANKKVKMVMPMPMMNILNGGKHAERSLDFQEYMVIPVGATSMAEAVRMGAEVFHALKKILSAKGFATTVGDEGGFAIPVDSNEQGLVLIMEAIKCAGYKPGRDIAIAMDAASTEFFGDGTYNLTRDGKKLSASELIALYGDWIKKYPIVSIEDGLGEDDWDNWVALTKKFGGKVQLVGDDLFVTNTIRLADGIKRGVGNSILIKVNQIGTITETIEAVEMAHKAGYTAVISHRSGETEDTTIAHLAVGLGTGQIKTGSLSRTERIAKYNELIRIAEELGTKASFSNPFKK